MNDASLPSHIVLVLGMHRSGSSTVTRSLSMLGYALPKTLIKGNASNRRGHWESQPIARLNDGYLNKADLTWADWVPGKLNTVSAQDRNNFETDIRALVADEFPAGTAVVLKEPRICRLVPRYRAALETQVPVTAVITVRNPLEVVASLAKRNGLSDANASLLWLRYMLDAVIASQGVPRAFVAYEDCLADPQAALSALADHAGLTYPNALETVLPELKDFLSGSLRTHSHTPEEVIHSDLTRGWVSDVYEALRVLTHDPSAVTALETIARVQREFDAATPLLGHIIQGYDREARDLSRRVAALSAAADLKTEQVKVLRAELASGVVVPDREPAQATAEVETQPKEPVQECRPKQENAEEGRQQYRSELEKVKSDRTRYRSELEKTQADRARYRTQLEQTREELQAAYARMAEKNLRGRIRRLRRKIKS